jgi:hypothetical protein
VVHDDPLPIHFQHPAFSDYAGRRPLKACSLSSFLLSSWPKSRSTEAKTTADSARIANVCLPEMAMESAQIDKGADRMRFAAIAKKSCLTRRLTRLIFGARSWSLS